MFKSNRYLYAQVVDDTVGKTLLDVSTLQSGVVYKSKSSVSAATVLGKLLAEKCLAAGLKGVVFDRSGYKYHGKIKAVAEAAREAGLAF